MKSEEVLLFQILEQCQKTLLSNVFLEHRVI